jgi:hypothetical protein
MYCNWLFFLDYMSTDLIVLWQVKLSPMSEVRTVVSAGGCADVDGCVVSMGGMKKGLAVVKDGGLVSEGGVVFFVGLSEVSPSGLECFFVRLLERWLS